VSQTVAEAAAAVQPSAVDTGLASLCLIARFLGIPALSEAKHDRLVIAHQVEGLQAQIASLVQQRSEADAEFHRQTLDALGKATQYAAEQRQELIKAAQRTGLQEMRAPVAGTVEQLSVHTVGGVVQPAQTLMVVVPDDSKLEVEAMLPNRDAPLSASSSIVSWII
jgi:hemolysin D